MHSQTIKRTPPPAEMEQNSFREITGTTVFNSKSKSQNNLSGLMRWIGVLVLLAGMATFMMQGINTISFLSRHWLFMGLTLAFGCIGIVLGTVFKETRGARTFLGIAIAAIPALYSQLGGMLLVLIDPPARILPQLLITPPQSSNATLTTILITIALSLPLVFFGFRVFIQKYALMFTAIFTFACMSLLYPERSGFANGIILITYCIVTSVIDRHLFRIIPALSTPEGTISRLLLCLPAGIMIVRNSFYVPSEMYSISLLTMAGIFCFFTLPLVLSTALRGIIQFTGAVAFSVAAVRLLVPFLDTYPSLFPNTPFTGCIIVTTILFVTSAGTVNSATALWYRRIAAALLIVGTIILQIEDTTPTAMFPAIIAGILVIITGYCTGERWVLYAGIGVGAAGIIYCCIRTMQHHTNLIWVFLALAGTIIIITASLFDRWKVAVASSSRKVNTPAKK